MRLICIDVSVAALSSASGSIDVTGVIASVDVFRQ
jgi:hypothetical protein